MSDSTSGISPTICFCFEHTRSDLELAYSDDALDTLIRQIAQACTDGLADCARLNPSGRCCLGEFRRIQRELAGGITPSAGCCDEDET